MKRQRLLIQALVLIVFLTSVSAAETEERVFTVNGPASLSISHISGDITIKTWDRNEIHVVSTRYSAEAELDFQQLGDRVRIETRKGEVRHQITAPPSTSLDLRSVSGDVYAAGLNGKIDVTTTSGNLRLEDVRDRIWAKTVSGNLEIHRGVGDVIEAKSVSGDLILDTVIGAVEAKSVSGNVRLVRARCPKLDIITASGDISYDGPLLKGGRYLLHTQSGNVRIALPGEASFELTASTLSGDIESDFPLMLSAGGGSDRHGRKEARAVYGAGDAQVDLKSSSGDIRIKKQLL